MKTIKFMEKLMNTTPENYAIDSSLWWECLESLSPEEKKHAVDKFLLQPDKDLIVELKNVLESVWSEYTRHLDSGYFFDQVTEVLNKAELLTTGDE